MVSAAGTSTETSAYTEAGHFGFIEAGNRALSAASTHHNLKLSSSRSLMITSWMLTSKAMPASLGTTWVNAELP